MNPTNTTQPTTATVIDPQAFKQAVTWAAQNPDSPQARELQTRITSGKYNSTISGMGLKPEQFGYKEPPAPPLPTGDAMFADTSEAKAAREKTVIHVGPILNKIGADAGQETAQGFMDAYRKAKEDFSAGTVAGGVHGVADVINGAFTPLSVAFNKLTGGLIPKMTEQIGKGLADIPAVEGVLNKLNDYFDKHPDAKRFALEDLPTFLNAATLGTGPKVGPQAAAETGAIVDAAAGAVKDVAAGVADASKVAVAGAKKVAKVMGEGVAPVTIGAEAPVVASDVASKSVVDSYTKAVKPTVINKGTAAKVAEYNGRVVSALDAIRQNKAALKFTDADGNLIEGKTPESVGQLSEAVGQTKADIFKRYDAMAKAAGDVGAKVNLSPVASELDAVINDKALGIAKPEAVAYAKELKNRILTEGEGADGRPIVRAPMDAETTQTLVQHYNESLKAFYRNPSYDTASRAAIDALVANKLRETLDSSIEGATGPGYQGLKSQYGALKTIESDVAKRAQVIARQNTPGFLGSMSNIASGAELVRGLLTLNPTDLAVSGTIKGIQLYTKWLNNPDRLVRKMFSDLESAGGPKPTGPSTPGAGSGKEGSASPNPTINGGDSKGAGFNPPAVGETAAEAPKPIGIEIPVERAQSGGELTSKGSSTFFTKPGATDSGFGPDIVKATISPEAKLFKGMSSQDYVAKNVGLDKPNPLVKEMPGLKTLAQVEEENADSWEATNDPNDYYRVFQKAAEDDLKAKGYQGAHWTSEDDLNPTQYQIWDKSVIKKQ